MRIIFILLITYASAYSQSINFERVALEHFFKNVFDEKYPNIDEIQFSGRTEDELSNFALFKNCFDLDSENIAVLDKKAYGNKFPVKQIDLSHLKNVAFKKKKVKSKLRMHVYQSNDTNNHYYIIFGIVKPKHFTHTYYYELDKAEKVIRWCETGMTE